MELLFLVGFTAFMAFVFYCLWAMARENMQRLRDREELERRMLEQLRRQQGYYDTYDDAGYEAYPWGDD